MEEGDEGTIGIFKADSDFSCLIQELPDRDNAHDVSRIPAGEYLCEWAESPEHGACYHVRGVPGRSDVLIHIGNIAGDKALGYATDAKGCLLPGITRTLFREGEKVGRHVLTRDQHGVSGSGIALKALEEEFRREPFVLTILR